MKNDWKMPTVNDHIILFPAAWQCTQICSLITFSAAWTLSSQCHNQFVDMCVLMCTLALRSVSCQGCQGRLQHGMWELRKTEKNKPLNGTARSRIHTHPRKEVTSPQLQAQLIYACSLQRKKKNHEEECLWTLSAMWTEGGTYKLGIPLIYKMTWSRRVIWQQRERLLLSDYKKSCWAMV